MSSLIKSHPFLHKDFKSVWYKRWAKELKQDKLHLDGNELYSNKFWQNAVMVQALYERGVLKDGTRGIGFGVGQERLPALFASHGVYVTATDQDFTTQKAGHWAAKELAVSVQSLNALGICEKKAFGEHVEYMPVDMTKVSSKLFGKYDFAWSNCALGHLGSIPAGLKFIEQSLKCLKPGGWAVHTTELNILSNNATVEGGSTVIFRLKDIYELQRKLISDGYKVSAFRLQFGKLLVDKRISIRPEFGNDYSKIQVMGHLATQIVLIIQKPEEPTDELYKLSSKMRLSRAYAGSIVALRRYAANDSAAKEILKSQKAPLQSIRIYPVASEVKVSVRRGKTASIALEYRNRSPVPLFPLYARLGGSKPVALATDVPRDRPSLFAADDWEGVNKNRAQSDVWTKKNSSYEKLDYVRPHQDFSFMLSLDASKAAKGEYEEIFSIVQEGGGWVENSQVKVKITVS
ncbi:hypothetical protein BH10PAT3_BH10PAT3_1590 [soil metagenome]